MRVGFRAVVLSLVIATGVSAGCTPDRGPTDEELLSRVESALAGAADLTGSDLGVTVSEGIVRITGSIACEDCGGQRTPGRAGTIEQTIGAIVRAIPGVQDLEFALDDGT